MKIVGKIEVEGVVLTVNVDAPDDCTQLYLTNVEPEHIALPLAQVPLSFLTLKPATLTELQRLGLANLAQLLDAGWHIKSLPELSSELRTEIATAIDRLRQTAAIVEPLPETVEVPVEGLVKLLPELSLAETAAITREILADPEVLAERIMLESGVGKLGLRPEAVKTLHRRYGTGMKLQDLFALSKARLTMTPGLTAMDVAMIELKARRMGFQLGSLTPIGGSTAPSASSDGSPELKTVDVMRQIATYAPPGKQGR